MVISVGVFSVASKYFLTDFILSFKLQEYFLNNAFAVIAMIRRKKDICIAIFLPMCIKGLEVLVYESGIPQAS